MHSWWLVKDEPYLWQVMNHSSTHSSIHSHGGGGHEALLPITLSVTLDRFHKDWLTYLRQYSWINYPDNLTQCDLLPMVRGWTRRH